MVPNAESALNEEAGKLLLEAYDDYAQRAKLMTKIHAMDSHAEFKKLSPTTADCDNQTQKSAPACTTTKLPTNEGQDAENDKPSAHNLCETAPATAETLDISKKRTVDSTSTPADVKRKADANKKRHLKRL